MALNMRLEVTSGVAITEVPEDIAEELKAAYDKLASLPVNRQLVVDFDDAKEARQFVRQGKAWAASQKGPNGRPLAFARKGDVKAAPKTVAFRIYEVREEKTDSE